MGKSITNKFQSNILQDSHIFTMSDIVCRAIIIPDDALAVNAARASAGMILRYDTILHFSHYKQLKKIILTKENSTGLDRSCFILNK